MSNTNIIFKEFILLHSPDEIEVIEAYDLNLEEISQIDRGIESELDDSLGFGESIDILSNVSAFIFLIIAEKTVELGLETSRDKLLKVLLENKEKVIKLSKERYNINVEKVISKIILFLEPKQ